MDSDCRIGIRTILQRLLEEWNVRMVSCLFLATRNTFRFQVEFEEFGEHGCVVFMSQRGIVLYFPHTSSISKFLETSTANSLSTEMASARPNLCSRPKLCSKMLHKLQSCLFRLGFKCLQASSDVLNGTIGHPPSRLRREDKKPVQQQQRWNEETGQH